MHSLLTAAPPRRSIARRVLRVICRRKHLRGQRLRPGSRLAAELRFDLLDIVDIILALENHFHITIPDEVPFVTVGDMVNYVACATLRLVRR